MELGTSYESNTMNAQSNTMKAESNIDKAQSNMVDAIVTTLEVDFG